MCTILHLRSVCMPRPRPCVLTGLTVNTGARPEDSDSWRPGKEEITSILRPTRNKKKSGFSLCPRILGYAWEKVQLVSAESCHVAGREDAERIVTDGRAEFVELVSGRFLRSFWEAGLKEADLKSAGRAFKRNVSCNKKTLMSRFHQRRYNPFYTLLYPEAAG